MRDIRHDIRLRDDLRSGVSPPITLRYALRDPRIGPHRDSPYTRGITYGKPAVPLPCFRAGK